MIDYYRLIRCKECPFLKNNNCKLFKCCKKPDSICYYIENPTIYLSTKQAIQVLHYHNKWRRSNSRGKMVLATLLGDSISKALRSMRYIVHNKLNV